MLSLSRIPFVTTILALLLAPPRSGFAASVQTSNCDALLLKGEQLLAEAKPQEGRKVILDATRACPKNSKGYALLGLAYDLESRFGEAQEAYRQAIVLDPGIAA